MSSTLYWRPEPEKKNELDDRLKRILAKHFWDQDGSLGSTKIRLDTKITMYLQGLADAGIADAKKLLKAIDKYGDILIWIEE